MFESPTPARLAALVAAALEAGPAEAEPETEPIRAVTDRPSVLPLAFGQRRLWFLHQVLPPGAAALYNGPLPVRLRGQLDPAALERSFGEIVRRHEVLRTAFRLVGDEPAQLILPELPLRIALVDLAAYPEAERLARTDRLAEAEARRPFDLEQPPLLRATLVRLGPEDHVLLLTIHHIVFDGWSAGVLLKELAALYGAFVRGEPSPLPPLPVQFADFAVWQQRWLAGPQLERQLAYWRTQLAHLPDLVLPTDAERPALPTYRGDIHPFRVSPEVTSALKQLSQDHDVTLFMTLLAGFAALLHRYTAQEDIVLSSPVANRRQAELEDLIGFFVNSLVLRLDLSGNPSFRQVLARVRQTTLAAYDHQDVPFERLVEELRPERAATHNPLFRAAFSLQNAPFPRVTLPGLELTPWETHNHTAKFDLVVALTDTGDGLAGDAEYATELFQPATIHTLVELYGRLLERVVQDPDGSILDIPLVDLRPVPAARLGNETFAL
jgi:hypothetical protein